MSPDAPDLRVVAYLRVSTQEQGRSGLGLDAQRRAIREHVARMGWTLVNTYWDVASGKTTAHRPGLVDAIALCESGGADALITAKLDRLSRSVADGTNILDRARRKGWGLVILDLQLDTTTPMGEMMVNVMLAMGQLERRMIGERTRLALAERRHQGLPMGRPRACDTDDAVAQARYRDALEAIRDMKNRKTGNQAIADALNERGIVGLQGGRWHESSVRAFARRYLESQEALTPK